MDEKEKLALIDRIICEAFEWDLDAGENADFLQGVISAISTIVNSGKEEDKEEA